MSTQPSWLIYGATGYTGAHIAQRAVECGQRPTLAGRDAAGLRAIAEPLGLPWQAVSLDDPAELQALVSQHSAVLHAAGPFKQTWKPMLEACLEAGAHYLDVTGELDVYEDIAGLDQRARQAGIMLMPGVGFDMVPGDCLALRLKRRLPDAVELDMGISFIGSITRGTIRSALHSFAPHPRVRRNHQLLPLTEALAREFDFGPGSHGGVDTAYAMDFGDVAIGWRSTGIASITSYMRPAPAFSAIAALKTEEDVAALPAGPSDEELRDCPSFLVGEVRNARGERRAARLRLRQIYAITFLTAADIAQRVHRGEYRSGFQTPASVFGEDYILGFEGCTLSEWTPQ